MTIRSTLRVCFSGMEGRSRDSFEIFLSRLGPKACQLADEDSADAAIIDMDNALGAYLVEGQRRLYPTRPLILTSQKPTTTDDPLVVTVMKPIGLSSFAAALDRVRGMLPEAEIPPFPALLKDDEEACLDLTAESVTGPITEMPLQSADQVTMLRQLEERLSTFYVGSMPDTDLDNEAACANIYYNPQSFLQGSVARAVAHAREINRPIKVSDGKGVVLFFDPRGNFVYQNRSTNALRALSQLPTRGTVTMAKVETRDAPLLEGLVTRSLESVEWDLALWASRGRLPKGTSLDRPVKLLIWPNLTRLALPPEAMRIAGLWSRNTPSLRETVRMLGIPQRYVFAFYSASLSLGLIAQLDRAVPAASTPPGQPRNPDSEPALRGLFKRLLGKLLGARLGEATAG